MKNTFKLIILAAIGITILGTIVLYQSPSVTLDQIIKNKDCVALDKWENEHMFDDDLNVSSEQLSASMKLAAECVGKALKNMFGNSALSTNTTDPMVILDEILKKEDCEGMDKWVLDNIDSNYEIPGLSTQVVNEMRSLRDECNFFP